MRWCSAASVALACVACSSPSGPSTTTVSVDVLQFLVGDAQLWPRQGDMSQAQVVDYDRREICWPKHANPRFFECWRWDDQFVYHEVDHAVDGNTGVSYRFADGRWMPRFFTGEWQLAVATQIAWFDPACRLDPVRSGPFRYRQRLWLEAARQGGGDVGTRDTLVLEYSPEDPAGGPTMAELFYFGRHAGWYEWARGDARRVFNRVGGPPIGIARDVLCQ